VIPSLWTILRNIILNIIPELINARVCIFIIIINRYIYFTSVPASQACRDGNLFIRSFFFTGFPDSFFLRIFFSFLTTGLLVGPSLFLLLQSEFFGAVLAGLFNTYFYYTGHRCPFIPVRKF
jgi:hypothetical protein